MEATYTDVVCPACGCTCDDLTLRLDADGTIVEMERACDLATPWFAAVNDAASPPALIEGRAAAVDDAISESAKILQAARAPLIYGLSRSSTGGQRAAIEMAESLGGVIDTTASVCHGPSIMAIQEVGESTCSLGEVKQRADLVIFWGADPVKSHPRHGERYSVDPVSEFLPHGREDRTVIVIDRKPTASCEMADQFIQVAHGRDYEMIWALRLLVRGIKPEHLPNCGVPLNELQRLADQMRQCKYGVVFFGLGLAQANQGHIIVDGLLRLVADLNSHTRFSARRLRIPGDVTGADSVLCWQTGFPFGVDFSRGYPRYNPGEFTANDLLARGEVDCCLLVGSESLSAFSQRALDMLQSLPVIAIDYPGTQPDFTPRVQFTSAVYGLDAPGTIYRMDETPLPLRQFRPSRYATDEELMRRMLRALAK
jgi:formylmethanofuran dehydrogenase subunit B